MKKNETPNLDELMDAWDGVDPAYLEEADELIRRGKKGQGRRRLAVLLAAAAVLFAAIGTGTALILRNHIRRSTVSAEDAGLRGNSTSDRTESILTQSESISDQPVRETDPYLQELAEKEEKLNLEEQEFSLAGCYRKIVVSEDGSMTVYPDDWMTIFRQQSSIRHEPYLCTFGEITCRIRIDDTEGKNTAFDAYDELIDEEGQKLFEIHAVSQYDGQVEQFLLTKNSGNQTEYQLYARDHSAVFSLSGNYFPEADGSIQDPVRSFVNLTAPVMEPNSGKVRIFADGSYEGVYTEVVLYDEENEQFMLLALEGTEAKYEGILPLPSGTEDADRSLIENFTLYRCSDNSMPGTEIGAFRKTQEISEVPEPEFAEFLSELTPGKQTEHHYLAYLPCTDAWASITDLPRLLFSGETEKLPLYDAYETINDAEMRYRLAEDYRYSEVSAEVLQGLTDEMIVLQLEPDRDHLLIMMEQSRLIIFRNRSNIRCFIPETSASVSFRGWYDEALCYAMGDRSMKREIPVIPDRGQNFTEAAQEYFDLIDGVHTGLPSGNKYALSYAKTVVEEAQTEEIPEWFRDQYQNSTHEILGAYRRTLIFVPENDASFCTYVSDTARYSGEDPDVPEGAYQNVTYGWTLRAPDGWYIYPDSLDPVSPPQDPPASYLSDNLGQSSDPSDETGEESVTIYTELSPALIPDTGQNWFEAAQEFADILTAPALPDPEFVTWQKTVARAFEPGVGLIASPDLTKYVGGVEIMRFYTTDHPEKVSMTDAPYQALLENWKSVDRVIPEGTLPAFYEDPEVPENAYVCRIYCWVRKDPDGWRIYGGGPSLGPAPEDSPTEGEVLQQFQGDYVRLRITDDHIEIDPSDTFGISERLFYSNYFYGQVEVENSRELTVTFDLGDGTIRTARLKSESSDDGLPIDLSVTRYRNDLETETGYYTKTDYLTADYTGLYRSADDAGSSNIILDEYGEMVYDGQHIPIIARSSDAGLLITGYDESGNMMKLLLSVSSEERKLVFLEGPDAGKEYLLETAAEDTRLPEIMEAFTEEEELWISHNEGECAGEFLPGKGTANYLQTLNAIGKASYVSADLPDTEEGKRTTFRGSDPDLLVTVLEDCELLILDDHGTKSCYAVSGRNPEEVKYAGASRELLLSSTIRNWYDEAEYAALLGNGYQEDAVIPDTGQDFLEAAKEYAGHVKDVVSRVCPDSKYAFDFHEIEVQVHDKDKDIIWNQAEPIVCWTTLWHADHIRAIRWNAAGSGFIYLGERTDIPPLAMSSTVFSRVHREPDGWHIGPFGTGIPTDASGQAEQNDAQTDAVWENPLPEEDRKSVLELAEENFMTLAYPQWYITEEEKEKIDREGISFVFVDPMEENSSLVKPTSEKYHIEDEPDRWAMLKAEKYLGWSVFLIKPHDTEEWMIIGYGK